MVFRVWNDGTFAGTGRLPGRDVKRDLAMHLYISYLSHSVCMERILPGRFSSHPAKRDNFYHISTPSSFAGTILCWLCKLFRVKSSRETSPTGKRPYRQTSPPSERPVTLLPSPSYYLSSSKWPHRLTQNLLHRNWQRTISLLCYSLATNLCF